MLQRVTFLFCLLFCLSGDSLFGQGIASMQGTVLDPSGAAIPGATVELVNVATQARQSTTSDSSGRYYFPQVSPGAYEVLGTAEGFVRVVIRDVRLLVAQPVTLNVQFEEIGSVSEVVSVTSESTQVNTVDASLGNAFDTRPILQLPFEARNVVGLLSLQPGVAYMRDTPITDPDDTRNGAVNGGKSDQANVTLDGVDVNDHQNRSAFTSVLRMTLDSVQEFRTTTVNANPDEGRSSGAQVALVTKSGTNAIHGSLYEFHRNTATSANSFFNNAVPAGPDNPRGGIERQKLIRNVFGASVGGPVVKNRLFYFANYEGRRDASEESIVRSVPSETLRQGIVRYQNTAGGVVTLSPSEIQARLGFPVSQAALSHLSLYPMPNDDTAGDGLNVRGFRFKSPLSLRYNTYITRWDYYVDQAGQHAVFVRGNLQNDRFNDPLQFPGQPFRYLNLNNSKGIAAGYNAMLSPTLFSTFRYGLTREGDEVSGANNFSAVSFRTIDDLSPLTRSLARIIPAHTIREDMNWIQGAHNVKFGFVMRHIRNQRRNYQTSFHRANINSSWLRGAGSELNAPFPDLDIRFRTAFRDAMSSALGLVSFVEARYNYDRDGGVLPVGAPVLRNFGQEDYELYAQDTWQVTRGLTLTAGVRWSLNPPVHEVNGVQVSPIPSLGEWFNTRGGLADQGRSQVEAGDVEFVLSDDPRGRPLYPFHKKNFAPRIALAYSPQASGGWLGKLFGGPGKTVIRSGFGMYYDVFGQGVVRLYDRAAIGLSNVIANPSSSETLASAPRFSGVQDIPQALLPAAPRGGFPQVAPPVFAITNSLDDTLKPPYSMALNFSIAREFGDGFLVQGSYVGRLSRRSLVQADLSMPTNLRDPRSGATYFQAAQQLAGMAQSGVSIDNVQPIAYWENLFPEAAGGGRTATQNIYELFEAVSPDYTYALYAMDIDCYPACPITGPFSFYNEQFSALAAWRSIAGGNYHAMQWTLRKRFSQGFQFDFNYTLSKSLDLGSAGERTAAYTDFIVNSWLPGQLKAVSDYDMRHQANANWVLELPFGRGKRLAPNAGGALNALIGGWQLSGLYRHSSGLPTGVLNPRAWPTNWNITGYATQTGPTPVQKTTRNAPAVAGLAGPNIFPDPARAILAWDASLPGESGQRNGVRGDGYFTLDLGLAKRFLMPYRETHSLQFRWEVFNVTNSVRFDPYTASVTLSNSGSFGKYQDLLVNPRVMQFALRYEF